MLVSRQIRSIKSVNYGLRSYANFCGPPRPPPCRCPQQQPGAGRRIVPPADCRPGPVPPNPCVPRFHHGRNTWRKYRNIVYFISIPLIIAQTFHAMAHQREPKGDCRDYEYMRRRTKRFPWGKRGIKTLFHNECTNHLPGECGPPALECDD